MATQALRALVLILLAVSQRVHAQVQPSIGMMQLTNRLDACATALKAMKAEVTTLMGSNARENQQKAKDFWCRGGELKCCVKTRTLYRAGSCDDVITGCPSEFENCDTTFTSSSFVATTPPGLVSPQTLMDPGLQGIGGLNTAAVQVSTKRSRSLWCVELLSTVPSPSPICDQASRLFVLDTNGTVMFNTAFPVDTCPAASDSVECEATDEVGDVAGEQEGIEAGVQDAIVRKNTLEAAKPACPGKPACTPASASPGKCCGPNPEHACNHKDKVCPQECRSVCCQSPTLCCSLQYKNFEVVTSASVATYPTAQMAAEMDESRKRYNTEQGTPGVLVTLVTSAMNNLGGGGDAGRHVRHYLANTGKEFVIEFKRMIEESPLARDCMRHDISLAMAAAEADPMGLAEDGYTVTFQSKAQQLRSASFDTDEARCPSIDVRTRPDDDVRFAFTGLSDWWNAVGLYHTWLNAQVTLKTDEFSMNVAYHLWDFYIFDNTGLTAGPVPGVTDDDLRQLHTWGRARDFIMQGTCTIAVKWKRGQSFDQATVVLN